MCAERRADAKQQNSASAVSPSGTSVTVVPLATSGTPWPRSQKPAAIVTDCPHPLPSEDPVDEARKATTPGRTTTARDSASAWSAASTPDGPRRTTTGAGAGLPSTVRVRAPRVVLVVLMVPIVVDRVVGTWHSPRRASLPAPTIGP